MSDGIRNSPPRLKVTDLVEIASTIYPGLSGRCGRVVELRKSQYAQTLDKYIVVIDHSTDQELLWDTELRPTTHKHSAAVP